MTSRALNAVIIEDEIESVQLLMTLLNSTGLATVTGYTTDPEDALQLVRSKKPDILFLDIRMPGKSGFDLLDDIRKSGSACPFVVFTTAYDDFAIKAFEYAAFDYLLKPVDPKRLGDTLRRCREMHENKLSQPHDELISTYRKLLFKNNSGMIFIDPDEILFVEAEGNYSVFNLISGKKEIITILIGKVEEQLPSDKFFRISRSFIINLKFLKKVNTRPLQCILSHNGNDYKCDISREKISELSGMIRSN
jgi:two-component system LytT family response regulator